MTEEVKILRAALKVATTTLEGWGHMKSLVVINKALKEADGIKDWTPSEPFKEGEHATLNGQEIVLGKSGSSKDEPNEN